MDAIRTLQFSWLGENHSKFMPVSTNPLTVKIECKTKKGHDIIAI